jgi:transcriptional regulator with XRE-family HTH domain
MVLKSREYVSNYRRFLARLKQARLEAKMSQDDVARKLGRPQSFISKCESGERRVDVVELQFLARTYKKPLTYFEVI